MKFKLRPAPASVAPPPPQGHLYLLKKVEPPDDVTSVLVHLSLIACGDLTCQAGAGLCCITDDVIRRPAELATLHFLSLCRLHHNGRQTPGKFGETLLRVRKHLEKDQSESPLLMPGRLSCWLRYLQDATLTFRQYKIVSPLWKLRPLTRRCS